ncbi:hypothetical protein [Burkholderia sp. SIMBA_062]
MKNESIHVGMDFSGTNPGRPSLIRLMRIGAQPQQPGSQDIDEERWI